MVGGLCILYLPREGDEISPPQSCTKLCCSHKDGGERGSLLGHKTADSGDGGGHMATAETVNLEKKSPSWLRLKVLSDVASSGPLLPRVCLLSV